MVQAKKNNRIDIANVKLPETLTSRRPMDDAESAAFIGMVDWQKIYAPVVALIFLRQPKTLQLINPTIAAKILEGLSFFGDEEAFTPPITPDGFWDAVIARAITDKAYSERIKNYHLLATRLTNDTLKRMKGK